METDEIQGVSGLLVEPPPSDVAIEVVTPRSGILRAVRSGDTGQLLRAAQQGDDDALGALLELLRPRIVLWAATRLSTELKARVEPEDVAQLVLLAVHKDFRTFQGADDGEVLGWVFAIGENRVRDLARYFGARKRSAPDAPRDPDEESGLAREIDDVRARRGAARCFTQTSPSEAAARSESMEQMNGALAALAPEHQTVLRLRDLESRSYEDVVKIMELESQGAARTLRCRALIALRRAMHADVQLQTGKDERK